MTRPLLDFEKDHFFLYSGPTDYLAVKISSRRKWIPDKGAWRYPNNGETLEAIRQNQDDIKFGLRAKYIFEALEREEKRQEIEIRKVQEIKLSKNLSNLPLPIKPGIKPYNHQRKAFLIGVKIPYFALLMDPGTGKTMVIISVMGYRFIHNQIKRALIVCPKSVLSEWDRQFKEFAGFPYRLEILDNDRVDDRIERLIEWKDTKGLQVACINYEASWRMEEYIRKWKPDIIICDESQEIAGRNSQQSKAIYRLGKSSKYRCIMTGTPVRIGPQDFFSQYRFLNPSILGTKWGRFKEEYMDFVSCKSREGNRFNKVSGYRNLDQLANKVHSIAYRIGLDEAVDLPPFIDQYLYVKLEPQALELYRKMEKSFLLKLEDEVITAPIALTLLLRLQQITGGFLPGEEKVHQVSKAKLNLLEDQINYYVNKLGQKMVIFCQYIPEIKAIEGLLKKKKIGYSLVYGKINNRERGVMISRFQNNPRVKVFLSQIGAGGIGITLTKAQTCIFYSYKRAYHNMQARRRIRRIGQNKKVRYIYLVAKGTVDEDIIGMIKKGEEISTLLVDDLRLMIEKRLKGEMKMPTIVNKEARRIVERVGEDLDAELENLIGELEADLSKASRGSNGSGVGEVRKISRREYEIRFPSEKKVEGSKTGRVTTKKGNSMEVKREKKNPINKDGSIITVKELASLLKTEPRNLRKWLRSKYGQAEGRWEWNDGDPMVEEIKRGFKG